MDRGEDLRDQFKCRLVKGTVCSLVLFWTCCCTTLERFRSLCNRLKIALLLPAAVVGSHEVGFAARFCVPRKISLHVGLGC